MIPRFSRLLAVLVASVLVAGVGAPGAKSDDTAGSLLHVHAVELRNSNGDIICTLFNSPEGFPSNGSKGLSDVTAHVENRQAMCNFVGIAPGTYALVVFHDENRNGKFDKVFGIPKEGYGFSNNLRPVFSAPSFKQAAFRFDGHEQSVTIRMRYGIR